MSGPRTFSACLALSLLLVLTGCTGGVKPTAEPVAAATPPPPPLLIHLPGISGALSFDHALVAGLKAGGVAEQAEILDWTGDKNRGLLALGSSAPNHEQARLLASRIEKLYRADPRTKIILTAHSGGAGIAVWALELLPRDVKIQSLVLIAAALSHDYDLSPALAHVSDQALSFYSQYDEVVLGYGTRTFGTIDRVFTEAGGYVGFSADHAKDPSQYAKLKQVPYDKAWIRLGNGGEHIGAMNTRFARQVIAPMILHRPPQLDPPRAVDPQVLEPTTQKVMSSR